MAFGLHPATAIHTSRGRSDIATHSAVVPGLVPGTHSTLARGGVCWRLQPRRPQALESRGSHHADRTMGPGNECRDDSLLVTRAAPPQTMGESDRPRRGKIGRAHV